MQLLAPDPSASLRIYAVWLPVLAGDERASRNGTYMPDARVIHYWDGDRAVGQWFSTQIDGNASVAWDTYYLYGPQAVWSTVPSPLADSGRTIYSERETLEMQVRALLGQ